VPGDAEGVVRCDTVELDRDGYVDTVASPRRDPKLPAAYREAVGRNATRTSTASHNHPSVLAAMRPYLASTARAEGKVEQVVLSAMS
jgi:hypothetical protein